MRILWKETKAFIGIRWTRTMGLDRYNMNAKDLKRILRKQTRCSTRHIIMLDKEYAPIQTSKVYALINDYEEATYISEIWDCDDIARDFINYVKKTVKEVSAENVALGMIIFKDHAQKIFVEEFKPHSKRDRYKVRYLDHRDWYIYAPNEHPKWIIM